jgi:hypothetical protein
MMPLSRAAMAQTIRFDKDKNVIWFISCLLQFVAPTGIPSIAFENTAVQPSRLANTAHASSQPAGCAQSLPPFLVPY